MTQPSKRLDQFHYRLIDTGASQSLILLHGTGGDENDLLPLVESYGERFNLLGLRGNSQEHGLNRFFKRSPEGVFDQEDIRSEAAKLAAFINDWLVTSHQKISDLTFIGYSNGANMILALLFLYPDMVDHAIVLHPKLPFKPPALDLSAKKVLISYGEQDQLIPASDTKEAIATLTELGAEVTVVAHPGGHEIRSVELEALDQFLSS